MTGTSEVTRAALRQLYRAYAAMDVGAIDALLDDLVLMHVGGHHPLSGDYVGKAAVWEYLGKVTEISGGQGGFEVHAITADDEGHGVALVTGTIRDHVRQVTHVYHLQNGRITEFWDSYLDARAEDAFWSAALGQSA